MVTKQNKVPTIYVAQLELTQLARKREQLRLQLDRMKNEPHDKKEMKARRKEIIREMNSLTFDIEGKIAECYRQNYEVVKQMLMMFVGMDFVTRLYDRAADTFRQVTVGKKQGELLDFVKLCKEVAVKANEVVQIIDEAGKDAMSMAYADMEDGIGEKILTGLESKVDAYGKTPAGRKYFFGDHLKH